LEVHAALPHAQLVGEPFLLFSLLWPDFVGYCRLMAVSADTSTVLIVCPHCIADNDESACFCHRCFTPLKAHAEIDPMYRIYSEWNTYRKAIAAPTRLITVIGMYLIFGPGFMAMAAMMFFGCIAIFDNPGDLFTVYGFGVLLVALFAVAQIGMYGTVLYRVTNNYLHRPIEQHSEPEETDEAPPEDEGPVGESS
jgi:hypothetical protein